MHTPEDVIGKTAMFFESGKLSYVTRVMVTKWLGADRYIVSDFENPEVFYETIGWNFTMEKEHEQPAEPCHDKYLEAYERISNGA